MKSISCRSGGDKPWCIVISRKLNVPNAERSFFIRHALRAARGWGVDFGLAARAAVATLRAT